MADKGKTIEHEKLREVLSQLSREERLVCIWKRAGFSSRDIAEFYGRSVASVDIVFARARRKLRHLLGELDVTRTARPQSMKTTRRSRRRQSKKSTT